MMNQPRVPTIVMVDDDPDDHLLVREALLENGFSAEFHQLLDGQELIDFLYGRGEFARDPAPRKPDLILLDINMPAMDGFETLRKLKACPEASIREIPVVILTTSREQEDVQTSYSLGACSYMEKPTGFEHLVGAMKVLLEYWFDVAQIPAGPHGHA